MDIGNKIKHLRKERKMTQRELGEISGIAETTIRQYELGLRNPKYNTLKKISKAFHVPMSELLEDEEEQFNPLAAIGEIAELIPKLPESKREALIADLMSIKIDPQTQINKGSTNQYVNKTVLNARNSVENELIENFYKLNNLGQSRLIEYLKELTEIKRYTQKM